MNTSSYELWIVGAVLLFTIAWVIVGTRVGPEPQEIEASHASGALDRMKDWATWLTGLQTAAIAGMGLLAKDEKGLLPLTPAQRTYAFIALVFLGASIILSTWVLACLPSIQQKLRSKPDTENDIFAQKIFSHVPFRLGSFTFLAHLYCVIGLTFFGAFVYAMM